MTKVICKRCGKEIDRKDARIYIFGKVGEACWLCETCDTEVLIEQLPGKED